MRASGVLGLNGVLGLILTMAVAGCSNLGFGEKGKRRTAIFIFAMMGEMSWRARFVVR